MKKEWSIFGNPKLGNMLHNKYVEQKRLHDNRLLKIREERDSLEKLDEKLSYNSLTIDDVNAILCIKNKQIRENYRLLMLGVLCILFLLIIFR